MVPLGSVEPHAAMLHVPPDDQPLYKVMKIENLVRSFAESYLHFNRVDAYHDFKDADSNDGAQLPLDRPANEGVRFRRAPEFSAADYYDRARSRTYACCFSLENSDDIWKAYGNGGERGKACIVFDFGKFRTTLNATLNSENVMLTYQGIHCHQIFSVNYGIVQYVDWDQYQANQDRLPNPIQYTYLKDARFSCEKELRVSLSAFGIGNFALAGRRSMEFSPSVRLVFDFRAAIANGAVRLIEVGADYDAVFLRDELAKLGIRPKLGSDLSIKPI